jgi:Pyruvate/2-oxoacid:ferredoxin oxidoreductase gamma subunit
VDATQIAQECGLMYGCVPMLSSTMLGAFAHVSGLLRLETLLDVWKTLSQGGGRSLEENLTAIRRGYEEVRGDW